MILGRAMVGSQEIKRNLRSRWPAFSQHVEVDRRARVRGDLR